METINEFIWRMRSFGDEIIVDDKNYSQDYDNNYSNESSFTISLTSLSPIIDKRVIDKRMIDKYAIEETECKKNEKKEGDDIIVTSKECCKIS
jgi:hypothetical protein